MGQICDLTGNRYGAWTVLGLSAERAPNKQILWLCRCDCGTVRDVVGASLVHKRSTSCGCENYRKISTGHGDISGTYWGRCRNRAKKDGIEFDISIEYAWNLFQNQQGKCAISGEAIFLTRRFAGVVSARGKMQTGCKKKGVVGNPIQTASLDRIDSSLGYIQGNVQWVHRTINYMKSHLSQPEFVFWCRAVANLQKQEDSAIVMAT